MTRLQNYINEEWLECLTDEELEEVMNIEPSKYYNVTSGLIGRWSFKSGKNNEYIVYCSKLSNDIYSMMFTYNSMDGETSTLTNLNDNPTAIFNSVYTTIKKEIIEKFYPKELRFEAEGDKRQRIYDVVIRR